MAQGTEGVDYVIAATAVIDKDRNRIVYVAGSRVPMDDAVRYGLVEAPKKTEPAEKPASKKTAARSKKGPAEDRAKKGPSEDR